MTETKEMTTTQAKPPSIPVGARGLNLRDIDEMWRFADICCKAGVAPASLDTPQKVFIALQAGFEVGLTPMQSLKGVCVINRSPSIWGDAAKALVESSRHCEYVKEWVTGSWDGADAVAHCEAKRDGRPEPTVRTFSYADAKRAGLLSKDNWKKYPLRMLQMRARSWAIRDQFPDCLCGLGIAEEQIDAMQAGPPSLESGDDAPTEELDALTDAMQADRTGALPAPPEEPDAVGDEATAAERQALAEEIVRGQGGDTAQELFS